MKMMRQKLKSQNGLSLIFALLILLVVTMVSTTIVIASVTAVKRTKQMKESRQRALALESAALMFQKKMMSGDEQLGELLAAPIKEYRMYDGEKEVTGGPFFISSNIEEFPQVSVICRIPQKEYETASAGEIAENEYQIIFTFQTKQDESYEDTLKLYGRAAEEMNSDGELSYTWLEASFQP